MQNYAIICLKGATFFSEFQVAECQIFNRHFTKNRPNIIISKRQMFNRPNVRQVTLPNRQLFKLPIFECTIFSKKCTVF
jgi:hypothetical protein